MGDRSGAPRPARLSVTDAIRLGGAGLRTRPLRVILSALGVAIGIGAMIAVAGISTSSRAQLDQQLARLGTNLLTVVPAQTQTGEPAQLPVESTRMIRRIGPVTAVSATGELTAHVYRNDRVPPGQTGGIDVLAANAALPGTVSAHLAAGSWFNAATARYPAVVLGSVAARRLGLPGPGVRVWLGDRWFVVAGVLQPVALAPELDSAALVGWSAARTYLHFDDHPTRVYVRAVEEQIPAVRAVLANTANPQRPGTVSVSRPSDALRAKQATDATLTAMLLGLGAVALLVGGVGVANTMIISVLERRAEVGLRRALGATRGQIRLQFLTESLLLSGLGGAGGAVIGILGTAGYATSRGWPVVVPVWASVGGIAATVLIGALAGLYPAVRASRLAPAAALSMP
ncbi:ABC transporter permease [Actinocatenispora comari]|uniref:ABC transporter permease n=1 Tax=Actinocatenispora comari TaxID=2807577 RepID=A0A8J4ALI7_9ACTN|nr:ABC transporter permease [Actinocatenispora comari]GIL32007.1 ABC transporter permease [Actinocatenispora comari]